MEGKKAKNNKKNKSYLKEKKKNSSTWYHMFHGTCDDYIRLQTLMTITTRVGLDTAQEQSNF